MNHPSRNKRNLLNSDELMNELISPYDSKKVFDINQNFADAGKLSLGFKLIKSYANAMNIKVNLSSHENKGTTISLYFDLTKRANILSRQSSKNNILSRLKSLKDLNLFSSSLKGSNYNIINNPNFLVRNSIIEVNDSHNINVSSDRSYLQDIIIDECEEIDELEEVNDQFEQSRYNLNDKYRFSLNLNDRPENKNNQNIKINVKSVAVKSRAEARTSTFNSVFSKRRNSLLKELKTFKEKQLT